MLRELQTSFEPLGAFAARARSRVRMEVFGVPADAQRKCVYIARGALGHVDRKRRDESEVRRPPVNAGASRATRATHDERAKGAIAYCGAAAHTALFARASERRMRSSHVCSQPDPPHGRQTTSGPARPVPAHESHVRSGGRGARSSSRPGAVRRRASATRSGGRDFTAAAHADRSRA